MTDIIASPAVKEAVKIVMEQQERLGKNAAEAVSAAAAIAFFSESSGFIVGNRSTSRMDAASVRNMTRRSIPMPTPPVGGRPYSIAVM